jgi:hypothetical protein
MKFRAIAALSENTNKIRLHVKTVSAILNAGFESFFTVGCVPASGDMLHTDTL